MFVCIVYRLVVVSCLLSPLYHPHTRYQSNMAKEVLDTIMTIQPKDSSGGTGETRESIVYKIAQDMLDKLPPDYIPHEVCSVVNSYILFGL